MACKATKTKVLVYCVRAGKLLVFRHLDFPWEEVGIQVPGGSVRDGEEILDAALRELVEETGRDGFVVESVLGQATYDISPLRSEVQQRHFVCAHPTAELPERWIGQEQHDGLQEPTRFEFFWLPLEKAHVLQSGQGALIHRLVKD